MALEPPGEIELEQHDMHFALLDPGRTDQFVDIDGARAERADNPLPLALADVRQRLGRALFIRGGKFGSRVARRAALRAPTMATIGALASSSLPLT